MNAKQWVGTRARVVHYEQSMVHQLLTVDAFPEYLQEIRRYVSQLSLFNVHSSTP